MAKDVLYIHSVIRLSHIGRQLCLYAVTLGFALMYRSRVSYQFRPKLSTELEVQ